MKAILRGVTVLSVFAVLGGCASTGKTGEDTREGSVLPANKGDLTIDVRNNLIPPTPVYIYLVPSSGIERDMGQIFSGDRVVKYRGMPLQGAFQLIAKGSERSVASPVIVLTKVQELTWDLERNFIQITKMYE